MIHAAQESSERHIRLTENEYGQADKQTFLVPWELWAQLRMMLAGNDGPKIVGDELSSRDCLAMADWIAEQQAACAAAFNQPSEEWPQELREKATAWGAHLFLWGDNDGKIVEQLAAFLEGGAVAVLAESRSHE